MGLLIPPPSVLSHLRKDGDEYKHRYGRGAHPERSQHPAPSPVYEPAFLHGYEKARYTIDEEGRKVYINE